MMNTSKQNNDKVTTAVALTENQGATQLFSFEDNRPEAKMHNEIQRKANSYSASLPSFQNNTAAVISRKENKTGMPDNLKSGIESLSGIDASDVRVHYNSNKPAQMNAHAYAQGSNIHIASGQEKHLAHEAWHTVQQKQGRVQPTTRVNGAAVNDNVGLEKEADVMGAKALQMKSNERLNIGTVNNWKESNMVQQLKTIISNPSENSIQLKTTSYRLVKGDKGKYLKKGEFRIDADGLSTFEYANLPNTQHTHKLEFSIDADRTKETDEAMNKGDNSNRPSGDVDDLGGANGSYTPEHGGAGHWSISGKTDVEISTYAKANDKSKVSAK